MIKKLILLSSILYITYSCDVLDVKPQSSIPAEDALKDKAGIERGIIGAYNGLQSLSYYGRTYSIFSDLAADNLSHPPNATATAYSEVDNNAILPENSSVDGIWSAIYDAINVANNVIAKVPEVADMTQDEKNVALGELYFLRALHHFNLTNYFGAIPIKISPIVGVDDVNVPRDHVDDVYQQIIDDLTFAAQHLPASSSTKIRASKYAATALLARVYLYKKDYANAKLSASDVINNGGYSIMNNYADIFSAENVNESIFEVDFTELDRNRIAEYNFPLTLNGRREVAPSTDILSKFTTGDQRLAATIAFSGTQPYVIKYDDLSTGSDNFIVIRLAEMYLIRAEAEAKSSADVQKIKDDINVIRQRAGLSNATASDIPSLITIIESERRLELAFEGHRWFDLVRTGRATEVLPTVTNINKTLFPIPLSEILINTNPGMTQNPGY
ncbi:MAG: RagB/SusD family nutrient uptake outer membrane protein [Saprospiraceae bacterium]